MASELSELSECEESCRQGDSVYTIPENTDGLKRYDSDTVTYSECSETGGISAITQDCMSNVVITNVCSVREGDINFDEDTSREDILKGWTTMPQKGASSSDTSVHQEEPCSVTSSTKEDDALQHQMLATESVVLSRQIPDLTLTNSISKPLNNIEQDEQNSASDPNLAKKMTEKQREPDTTKILLPEAGISQLKEQQKNSHTIELQSDSGCEVKPRYRKRPHSEVDYGQERDTECANSGKRQMLTADGACEYSSTSEIPEISNSIINSTLQSRFTQQHEPSSQTATLNALDGTQAKGVYGTLSKPLLVPSSCTSKKDSLPPRNIQTKSVFLNIPSTLGQNRTSNNQAMMSSLTGISQSSTSQTKTSSTGYDRQANASEHRVNEQLVNYLSRLEDKPGTHQMVNIPMPDGSVQNVKVVYAGSAQQSVSDSVPAVSDTSTVETISVDKNIPSASVTSLSSRSSNTIQRQGNKPSLVAAVSVVSSHLKPTFVTVPHQSAPTIVTSSVSAQPVSSATHSLNSGHSASSSTRPASSVIIIPQNKLSTSKSPAPTTVKIISPQVLQTMKMALTSRQSGVQSKIPALQPKPVSNSKSPITSLEPNIHMDQVSTVVRLSTTDMATLLQGNIDPSLESIQQPGKPHSVRSVYRCVECGIMCFTLVGYTAHVKRISMVIRYACISCRTVLVFFNKCTFLAHLRKHAAVDSSNGHVLNLKSHTMSVSSLPEPLLHPAADKHMEPLVLNRNQPTSCSECHEEFRDTSQLNIHFGSNTETCTFEYSCTHCHMELPTSCALKAHLRLHDEESHTFFAQPDFVCPECGLRFGNQLSLYQHLFATCLHFNRVVILQCSICKCKCHSLKMLEDHLTASHPSASRFNCHVCIRIYGDSSTFVNDTSELYTVVEDQVHFVPKSCSYCRSEKLERKEHAKLLEQAKKKATFAFTCFFCTRGTKLPSRIQLVEHLNTYHNAYSFCCTICQQGFVTLSLLRSHVLSTHSAKNVKDGKNADSKLTCHTCSFSDLNSESALPHVLWHTVRKVTRRSKPPKPSPSNGNIYSMEITAPKIRMSNTSAGQRLMPICRICGYVSSTSFAMHRHIGILKHAVLGTYFICPFCQRFDFCSSMQFRKHKRTCRRRNVAANSYDLRGPDAQEEIEKRNSRNLQDGSTVDPKKRLTEKRMEVDTRKRVGKTAASDLPQTVSVISKSEMQGVKQKHAVFPSLSGKPAKMARLESKPMQGGMQVITLSLSDVLSKQSTSELNNTLTNLANKRKRNFFMLDRSKGTYSVEPTDPPLLYHPCHLCGSTYSSADKLSDHLISKHDGVKTVLNCKLCQKKGKNVSLSKMNLKKHLVRRHNVAKPVAERMVIESMETGVTSPEGQVSTSSSSQRISTEPEPSTSVSNPVKCLRIADGSQDYVCAKCNFSSQSKEDFHNHITMHVMENSVQCLECGLCFSSVSSLKKHLFMVHKVKQPAAYIEEHNIKLDDLPREMAMCMNKLTPFEEPEVIIKAGNVSYENLSDSEPVSQVQAQNRSPQSKEGDSSQWECNVCYKEFENESVLKSHMRTHGMAFIRSRRTVTRQTGSKKSPALETSEENSSESLNSVQEASP